MLLAAATLVLAGTNQNLPAQVTPEASKLVRQMSDKLAAAQNFSFSGVRTLDSSLVPMKGEKPPQYRTDIAVAVSRPDKFYVIARGEEDTRQFYFNGREFVLYDAKARSYGKVLAKSVTIDQMLGHLQTRWGFLPPLSDFIMSDSYKMLMDDVKKGRVVLEKMASVSGCTRLAFEQDDVDWDLWLSNQDSLPRKLLIVFKKKKGSPRFEFLFDGWNLNAGIPDSRFVYTPAKGVVERELTPLRAK